MRGLLGAVLVLLAALPVAAAALAENVLRLAGQREDYLVKALGEYKNNTPRGYDAAMAEVLYAISDEQSRDLAYFLACIR